LNCLHREIICPKVIVNFTSQIRRSIVHYLLDEYLLIERYESFLSFRRPQDVTRCTEISSIFNCWT
jgi:hypothetical protein